MWAYYILSFFFNFRLFLVESCLIPKPCLKTRNAWNYTWMRTRPMLSRIQERCRMLWPRSYPLVCPSMSVPRNLLGVDILVLRTQLCQTCHCITKYLLQHQAEVVWHTPHLEIRWSLLAVIVRQNYFLSASERRGPLTSPSSTTSAATVMMLRCDGPDYLDKYFFKTEHKIKVSPTCNQWTDLEGFEENGDGFKISGAQICTDICGPEVPFENEYCKVRSWNTTCE